MSKTVELRTCRYFKSCGVIERYNGIKRIEHWRKDKEGNWLCDKHYTRLIRNPRRTKEEIKKYNDRYVSGCRKEYCSKTIVFLGKVFYLGWNPRKGYCSWCPNNIHDKSCKSTNMHHLLYVPIMVWACTEELCASCHGVETRSK